MTRGRGYTIEECATKRGVDRLGLLVDVDVNGNVFRKCFDARTVPNAVWSAFNSHGDKAGVHHTSYAHADAKREGEIARWVDNRCWTVEVPYGPFAVVWVCFNS